MKIYKPGRIHVLLALCLALPARAQQFAASQTPPAVKPVPQVDLAITYTGEVNKYTYGSTIFLQGGAAELAAPVNRHLSLLFNVTGLHTGGTNGGAALSEVLYTGGGRVNLPLKVHLGGAQQGAGSRLFGQATFGGVHAWEATFPSNVNPPSQSNTSLAYTVGAGYDIDWKHNLAFRVLQVDYEHTRLPNGTTNVQNNVRFSVGLVFRPHIYGAGQVR